MDLYIPAIPIWINESATLLVVAVAVLRGDRDARIAALVVAYQGINEHFVILRWTMGAPTDLASLIILLWLVLRSRRYWTIWAAASALLSLAGQGIYYLLPGMGLWAHMSAQAAFSYVLRGAILYGSLQRPRPSPLDGAPPTAPASP